MRPRSSAAPWTVAAHARTGYLFAAFIDTWIGAEPANIMMFGVVRQAFEQSLCSRLERTRWQSGMANLDSVDEDIIPGTASSYRPGET